MLEIYCRLMNIFGAVKLVIHTNYVNVRKYAELERNSYEEH